MVSFGSHIIANQLQYVSRQLHKETRGLAVRYNDIIIQQSHGSNLGEQAARFLDRCPLMEQRFIRNIIVLPSGPQQSKGSFSELASFCINNPEATVKLHFPIPRKEKPDFLDEMFLLKYIIRGDTSFFDQRPQDALAQSYYQRIVRTKRCTAPRNLRFFPAEEVFNEQTFRESYVKASWFHLPSLRTIEEIDKVVLVVKEWFQKGA